MYCVARVRLGLTYEDFYSLTWYEWGFESLKILDQDRRLLQQQEFQMELIGRFMALFHNMNIDPKKTMPVDRRHFFKLSYDTKLTEEVDPDLFNKVARRLGSKIKGKDSGVQ